MITAVLDSNTLLSGFVGITRPHSTPGLLLRAWIAGSFELIVSEPILVEVARNIQKPYFRRRLAPAQVAEDLHRLRAVARLTPITVLVSGVATHPEDDDILATAVSGRVDYLVTGDRALQAVGTYHGVTILSPLAFLTELRQLPGPLTS